MKWDIPNDHYFPDGSVCKYWVGKDGEVHGQVFTKKGRPESKEFTMRPDALERALARDRGER